VPGHSHLVDERDACGVGFVAQPGAASHAVVQKALGALGCMEHRGACAADGSSGDGAGVLTEVPWPLLARDCPALQVCWGGVGGRRGALGAPTLHPLCPMLECRRHAWVVVPPYPPPFPRLPWTPAGPSVSGCCSSTGTTSAAPPPKPSSWHRCAFFI
jgi:hypothetical protein